MIYLRLDKVILCRHSTVLRDVLSIPSLANPTFDGAVLLHMHDDADDLARLMSAIYDKTYVALLDIHIPRFTLLDVARSRRSRRTPICRSTSSR